MAESKSNNIDDFFNVKQSSTFTIPNRKLVWLITGCSSGFGLALARYALSQGHTVIATSRDPSRTPELVAEFEGSKPPTDGPKSRWLKLDLNDLDCDRIVNQLEEEGVAIDVLATCAGTGVMGVPVEQLPEPHLRNMMEVGFFANVRLIRAVVPHMRQRRFGVFLNLSSGGSFKPAEAMGGYCAMKAAMDAFAISLSREMVAFNVRVINVPLGTAQTNFGHTVKRATHAAGVTLETLNPAYRGSVSEVILNVVSEPDKFKSGGDKNKFAKAMYEVVVGEGVGKGKEGEKVLLLGSEIPGALEETAKEMLRVVEVFGELANSLQAD